jgi:hypothetical protein
MQWDLTKRKRASRKHQIVKCPVCDKYGQAVLYIDGTPGCAGMIKHKGHIEMGFFNMIDDSCTLNIDQADIINQWLKEA